MDLIICAVVGEPIIVTLDRWGRVHWDTNYSAIGEGSDVARAMLCLQPSDGRGERGNAGQFESVPLPSCLYRVYETKEAAHIANPTSVGEATQFEILLAGGKRYSISAEGVKYFDKRKPMSSITVPE